ncbi:hypothetical protein M8994_11530 [Brucella sp. 21LCYQ03]|nr:hypothetical protein [Brucella sp. 21LCYQ03]
MFQMIGSGRSHRLRTATAPHRERLDELYVNQSMFGAMESYKHYLQATLATRIHLETMLEVSHIAALYSQWSDITLERHLLDDLDDIKDVIAEVVIEPKRSTRPVDLATVIGTLYALEATAFGAQQRADQAAHLGCAGNYGARHLAKQSISLKFSSQVTKLIEITPLDDDDEERCTFAAIAALGAFEYNYLKVFKYVARNAA